MVVITKDEKVNKVPTGMVDQFVANGWEVVGNDGDFGDMETNFILGKKYGALGADMLPETEEDEPEEEVEKKPRKISQMSVTELKEALDKYGVEYKQDSVKEELKRLLYQYKKAQKDND